MLANVNREEQDDRTIYKVVVNHEEQYSIWPADRESPAGWRDAGKRGPKAECLSYVEQVWTDMRPLSLRTQLEEAARNPAPPAVPAPVDDGPDLVTRLCTGEHPIQAILHHDLSAAGLKERIDRGYVHIKFTGTRGGTEIGVRLERDRCDLGQADFERGTGNVRLVGSLTLDYVPVRCEARIELETLSGQGHLERVEG
jgi:uncharacterized protein YbdZ (MbtH family)